MLSLEVVGPGDGLSTVPSATPYWRDVSWRVSWQAVTAMAAHSFDRTVAVLLLWLGERLAVTTAVRHRFPTAIGSRFIIFARYIRPFYLFGPLILYMFAYFHISTYFNSYGQ
jgi:hypothetical protein